MNTEKKAAPAGYGQTTQPKGKKNLPTHQLYFNPLTLAYKVVSINRALQRRENGWNRIAWGSLEKMTSQKNSLELQKLSR